MASTVSVRELAAKFAKATTTPQTPDQFETVQRAQRQAESSAKQLARERAARYNLSLRADTLRRKSEAAYLLNSTLQNTRSRRTEAGKGTKHGRSHDKHHHHRKKHHHKKDKKRGGRRKPRAEVSNNSNTENPSAIGRFLRTIRWSLKPESKDDMAPEAILQQEAKRLNSRPKKRTATLQGIEEEEEELPTTTRPSSTGGKQKTRTSLLRRKQNPAEPTTTNPARRSTAIQAISPNANGHDDDSGELNTDDMNRAILSAYLAEAARPTQKEMTNLDDPEVFEDEVDRLLGEVRGREGSFFEALAAAPALGENSTSDVVESRTGLGSFGSFLDTFDFDHLDDSGSDHEDSDSEEDMYTPVDSAVEESDEDMQHWRSVLTSFYRVYDPALLPKVNNMLNKYRQRRDQMLSKLEREYQVTFSEDGFAHVDQVGENVDRLKEQLVAFYKEKRPNHKQTDKEIEDRINRMMTKYSFKDLAGVIRKLFGELPLGWEEELASALDL